MSLTADIADAIIDVDKALARFEQANAIAANSRAYRALKEAIAGLQETACGEGMHFESADEARRFRDATDHTYVVPAPGVTGCGFYYYKSYDGEFRCGKTPAQHY